MIKEICSVPILQIYHERVPTITVIVDGGWSKHTGIPILPTLSGIYIIIGSATGKLLFLDVQNKYCSGIMCENNIHCFHYLFGEKREYIANTSIEMTLKMVESKSNPN